MGRFAGQGRLDDALEMYRLALQLRRAGLGEEARPTQDTLYNIASCYAAQKRYKEAADILARLAPTRLRPVAARPPAIRWTVAPVQRWR